MKLISMTKIRVLLAVVSGSIFITLISNIAITGAFKDIIAVLLLIFFGFNTFYIMFSNSKFKASSVLDGAATKLAIITLEMKYLAEEAKIREHIEERLQQQHLQEKLDKSLAAKDFLKFARSHPLLSSKYDLTAPQSVSKTPPANQSIYSDHSK